MNQRTILRPDWHNLVALDDLLHAPDQSGVTYHLGKPFAYPMTRLRPGDMSRKPASHIYLGDFCVLLDEDCTD